MLECMPILRYVLIYVIEIGQSLVISVNISLIDTTFSLKKYPIVCTYIPRNIWFVLPYIYSILIFDLPIDLWTSVRYSLSTLWNTTAEEFEVFICHGTVIFYTRTVWCNYSTVKKTCINGRVHFFQWRSNILNLVDFVSRQLLSFRLYIFSSHSYVCFTKLCTSLILQKILRFLNKASRAV